MSPSPPQELEQGAMGPGSSSENNILFGINLIKIITIFTTIYKTGIIHPSSQVNRIRTLNPS